jgi:hypothetical protein
MLFVTEARMGAGKILDPRFWCLDAGKMQSEKSDENLDRIYMIIRIIQRLITKGRTPS